MRQKHLLLFPDIHLIKGRAGSIPAWYYVRILRRNAEICLKEPLTAESIARYGEVLCSGWGEEPPMEIRQRYEGNQGDEQ